MHDSKLDSDLETRGFGLEGTPLFTATAGISWFDRIESGPLKPALPALCF
jgi:hypothetical protein